MHMAFQDAPDRARHDRLAQPPHQQAGDGHPQLGAGNQQAKIPEQRLHQPGANVTLARELLDARPPNAQQRIFRRYEEGV